MMKTWRKSLAIFCALALVFSMVPTAFADFTDDNDTQSGEPTVIVLDAPESDDVNSDDDDEGEPEDEPPVIMQTNSLLYNVEDSTTPITIFYTSDLHGAFTGRNFATDGTHAGMARVATLLKAERTNVGAGNYITLDLGDSVQGAGSSGFIGNDNYTFPLMKAFNYLEYNAVILGNHEFNFGIDNMYLAYNGNGGNSVGFLGDKLTGNVFYHDGTPPNEAAGEIDGTDSLLNEFESYAIYTINGINVAVIGMTHPGSDVWDAIKLESANIYTESVTTATIRAIEEIKDGDFADIIVLAVHTSQSNSFDRDGSGAISILENNYVAENVDVFLGAHGHSRTYDRVINGVRYIENSSNGGSMGIVTLNATQRDDGTWYIADKVNDVNTVARQISTSSSNANYVEEDEAYLAHMAAEIAFAKTYTA
jgi:5''-nucleotidase/2'',3''-cyclic phosphodiesterase and related esterases